MTEQTTAPEWRSASLATLAAAKARAQLKFDPIGKDKSATVNLKSGASYSYAYADLSTCLAAVVPALSAEGLALFQPVHVVDGMATAKTLLVHAESGEWISGEYASPVVDSRDARSVGSAATYARRYGLLALLAIASSDEDDDGERARGGGHEMAAARPTRTEAQEITRGEVREMAQGARPLPPPEEGPVMAFGSGKGKTARELDDRSLGWYLGVMQENVADPAKAKFRASNLRLLNALDAESTRRREELDVPERSEPDVPF